MSDEPKESESRRAFRDRLEKEVVPGLSQPRSNMRIAVATNILAIVDRQIGQGDHEARKEWEQLKDLVKGQPEAATMIANLEEAVHKYDEDLQAKIQAGADEAKLRASAADLLKRVVMSMAKPPAESEAGAKKTEA
jgi:uncharacterized protein DUF6285